jgi:hypothetical protein
MSTEGKVSIYGSGRDMPIDYLLRKQERTCMYESPSLVEDFQRQTLKDLRPLKPLFESDEIRGGRDVNGQAFGNNISDRFLTFRDTGFQSRGCVDGHNQPDGIFINTGGATELDPRGVALGPNMRAHVDQQYARGSLYNYRPDGDASVPESGINPWVMNSNVRGIQNISKDYFKNFSTGLDGWHNGATAPGYVVSNKQKLVDGQLIKDPATAPNRNKMDATTVLSNTLKIGWRRTTDNEFKVSKYGKKNFGKPYNAEDWYKNRANVTIDHDILMSWQDVNVSKATALKMIDLSKQKFDKHQTGLHGIEWDESKDGKGNKVKLVPKDMAGMAKRPTLETQPITPHTNIKGEVNTSSGEKLMIHDAPNISKTRINSTMFEKMGQANKAVTKKQKSNLRASVKRSAESNYVDILETNKKKKPQVINNAILWDSLAVFKKGDEKAIMNYKSAKKKSNKHNLEKINKHKFEKDSYTNKQHKITKIAKIIHGKKTTRQDNDFGKEGVFTRSIGPMGNKQTMKYMERDSVSNEMDDISSRRQIT